MTAHLRGGGHLEEVPERLAVLPGAVVEPARLQVVLLPLEVDGDAVVVLGRGVLTHDVREQVHLGVLLRQLK